MPHKESPDGYLSVTEVLSLTIDKPFLRYWYGKHGTAKCEQIKRESQELGTLVHSLIEESLTHGRSDLEDGRHHAMVNTFWEEFVVPHKVEVVSLEQTVKDKKLKLQGTYDAVIKTPEGEFTADWKTSNQLDKIGLPLQLCMYDHLRKGSGKGVAIRIDKTEDKIQIKWFDDLRQYWPACKAAIKLAKYIKFGEV